ncbi:MAG: 50S ribosomal protein P1 [Candidatus Aenigmatarchaeota archaeon]|nr:MAG: 50S ribosomal protein P1 [Candidatus Aenigmarchaeota archaeon]
MEYIYSAMLLHSAGKEINEENVKNVLKAAGVEVDEARVKALVAALEKVDIDEAIKKGSVVQAAPTAVEAAPEKVEEEKKEEEEEKKEEEAAEGLSSLFG